MLTIPMEAMPVVEVLRREVPRPKELPNLKDGRLRWENGCCAMGLAPKAREKCPLSHYRFGYEEVDYSSVFNFYRWFDMQTDAQGVVDAIWPVEG